LKLRIVGVPVVDRQNLRLVKKLPEKLKDRQGSECPVVAHLKPGKETAVGLFASAHNKFAARFPVMNVPKFCQDKLAASECAASAARHKTACPS
jgi:hypothetical protein